ncbi:MAG: histidinol-phosphate transaminase [Chloroflexi bacterium]|nr:histidinol-phosphate transaminase [Chloroflexota bacterium]
MQSKTEPRILSLVQPHLLELLGYAPIEPAELLAERLGIAPERIVKLDGNENPYGPSPGTVTALAGFKDYNRYPDPQQRSLRAALSDYTGVAGEHIVAGAGSDELIDLLLRAVVGRGDGVIECPPTFGMYGFSTRVAGGRSVVVPRREDFSLDMPGILAKAGDAKMIFLASPNNPTGNPLSGDELEQLLDTDLLVVIDEAYIEFAGEFAGPDEDFVSLVPQRENLIVLRTFSKWAGLAGLRAGYGIMPAALADVLMHMKPPYSPSIAAEVAMLASLEDRELLMERVGEIVRERERMADALTSLGMLDVYPSQANFLLARLRAGDARAVHDALAQQGVFVRYFDTPELQSCLRFSAGTLSDTDRLLAALREQGGARGR